jgi:hypothetical protein
LFKLRNADVSKGDTFGSMNAGCPNEDFRLTGAYPFLAFRPFLNSEKKALAHAVETITENRMVS